MRRRLVAVSGLFVAGTACSGPDAQSDPSLTSTTITATAGDDGSGATGTATTAADTVNPTAGDASGTTGDMNCGEEQFMLAAQPPNVMLVLDRSGSMTDQSWDGDANPATPDVTRWASLHAVVDAVTTTFEAEIDFGAAFFPSAGAIDQLGAGACITNAMPEVPVAPMNAAAILAALPPADTPDLMGATPATAGVQSALDHLSTLDDNVDRFMILVTDGAANCSADASRADCPGLGCDLMEDYDLRLPQVVGAAYAESSVPTFVVGIDIRDELVGVGPDGIEGTADDDDGQVAANTFERLNDVAVAGGRDRPGAEKFFNAANELELQTALDEIAGQVFNCTIALDGEPVHPDFVDVFVGGMPLTRVDDCATEDGWVYTNPDGPYDGIVMCGSACDLLAEVGLLDVTFGCPPPG